MTPAARRAATLERFASHAFDLLIVGGGATGAATARDAALRGLDVALCEAGDFAGETSSQSSKLIHGGLRYLQYGNLQLVFEEGYSPADNGRHEPGPILQVLEVPIPCKGHEQV